MDVYFAVFTDNLWSTKIKSMKITINNSVHMIGVLYYTQCTTWNWTVMSEPTIYSKTIGLLEYVAVIMCEREKTHIQWQIRKRIALLAMCLEPSLVFAAFMQKHVTITCTITGTRRFSLDLPHGVVSNSQTLLHWRHLLAHIWRTVGLQEKGSGCVGLPQGVLELPCEYTFIDSEDIVYTTK